MEQHSETPPPRLPRVMQTWAKLQMEILQKEDRQNCFKQGGTSQQNNQSNPWGEGKYVRRV